MQSLFKMNSPAYYRKPLIGDWIVMIASLAAVIYLFQTLWINTPASQLKIRQGDTIIGTYDLDQIKELHIHGPLGESLISINQGKVRFKQSPCNNQSYRASRCLPAKPSQHPTKW